MFGAKPTGFASSFGASGTQGFGSPAFGASTPASGGLFGQTSTSSTGSGLFGGGGTSAFGAQQTGFNFGATPAASGGLFGAKTTANSLFGTSTASNSPFGFGNNAAGPRFGTATTSSGGLFGTSASTGGGGLFGSSAGFGQQQPPQQQQTGTPLKFNPPTGQDNMVKNGVTNNINTKHQCITAMKEYEGKSLEELRSEDYAANRKGKQVGSSGFGFGGGTATSTQQSTGFNFGGGQAGFGASTGFGAGTSTGSTSLFGQTTTAQSGGLFGANKPLFGTATTTQSGFGFGSSTSTGTSLFGQPQANKPLFGAASTGTQPSLFGAGTSTFGQTPAASSGFGGGFGAASNTGGLFANKTPAFGTQTTASSSGFNFGATPSTGSNLFAKPFSQPSTGFGFGNTNTTSTAFGAATGFNKPTGFGLTTTTAAPAFNFGGGLNAGGSNMFGNNALNKPTGFGTMGATGSTGFGGFGSTGLNLGGAAPTLGSTTAQTAQDSASQIQQTLLTLTHSPYGDSPLFWNMKESKTKRDDVLKPTNPAAQKAVLANQHKVSPRPIAKIKPKALHGVLNGSKAQIFEGLEDDDFSFGNDTFMPRKSVKKLTLKKNGLDSGTPSRASSVSGDPINLSGIRDDEQFRARSPEMHPGQGDIVLERVPETENIIRSKGIPDHMADTPNRGPSMDDTIAQLNAKNRSQQPQEPLVSQSLQPDPVNISIISRDDSNTDDVIDERPMTPPPPHPAGVVLSRPGYYTIPSLEDLGEMVDDKGDCFVEDFTIGREGYGSIFFPDVTNVANMNFDETVFFRRKEVIVYPDDENKPPVGEGLNKKAEITLDCVWPRDKSIGTPIKSPEKLRAMKWQDKIEENSLKVGAKFIDYRPETGSWVFEVKHFSKYGLVDDSDEEDLPEQEKKRLRTAQEQQMAVQKQKIHMEQLQKQQAQQKAGLNGQQNGQMAKFTIGTDEESDGSLAARNEVPMGDDEIQIVDTQAPYREIAGETEYEMEMQEDQPSSHRLATSMGVDARNMQVMKASFFGEEEGPRPSFGGDMFSKKSMPLSAPSLVRQSDKSGPSLFSSALTSKYMSPVKPNLPQSEANKERALFSPRLITPEPLRATPQVYHPPVKEYLLLASGMKPDDYPKKIVGSKVSREYPRVQDGYQYNKQELLVDAGLFMGRSFRVGWGPGGTLVHSGDIIQALPKEEEKPAGGFNLFTSQPIKPTGSNSEWKVHLQKLNIADHINPQDKTVLQNHREMLEIQLVHSLSAKEGICPVFTPALGVEALHQYSERNQDELDSLCSHPDEATVKHMGMVWDLCVALWGNMPEFKDMDIARDSYMYHNARREAFSKWLSAVSRSVINKEVQENRFKEQGHFEAILSSLTGRQISEACQLAQKSGDHKLALLLAQAVSNYIPRQMTNKQLEEWIELGVPDFMSETVLKIYSLLSGQLVLTSSNFTVNACEGLDWKRSLGLHLWFCCQLDSPIQEAVELFDRAYGGSGDYQSYTGPPLPPYLEDDTETCTGLEENNVKDVCYHLLRLYCQKCHQLEQLLNPVTSTRNQLDYRLSWHLSQVLQSLCYHNLSPYHRACLHMNFASHLESLGLWEWAVFVALHVENPVSRQTAVQTILSRHIQLVTAEEYVEKEELIKEKLLVPEEWIHQAKALRASYENRPREEAWHLLKGRQWNRCHQILLRDLAADAVIHDKHEYLREFLLELSAPAHSATILDWHIGGKVYLEYINICHSMKLLSKSGQVDHYELDRLLPEVKSLCTKVSSIPCRNSKDRLCQSEMAKKAANFLRLILTLQSEARGESQPPVRLLAPYISNIPMPEDYSLQELRALTRSFIREQTVS